MLWIVAGIVGLVVVAFALWTAMNVIRGNNYHRMVREAVIAELGAPALPILTSPQIVKAITDEYARGMPPASVALGLIVTIRNNFEADEIGVLD